MTAVDVYFCRYRGELYMALADVDEPPVNDCIPVPNVKYGMALVRQRGVDIHINGIVWPEMMGLGFDDDYWDYPEGA